MAEAGMQRLVTRVVGWVIWAALVTWATVFLWAVMGGPAFDVSLVSDIFWAWAGIVLFGAVAGIAVVAWLVAFTDPSPDEPRYRL
jgi:hypothetical protein